MAVCDLNGDSLATPFKLATRGILGIPFSPATTETGAKDFVMGAPVTAPARFKIGGRTPGRETGALTGVACREIYSGFCVRIAEWIAE